MMSSDARDARRIDWARLWARGVLLSIAILGFTAGGLLLTIGLMRSQLDREERAGFVMVGALALFFGGVVHLLYWAWSHWQPRAATITALVLHIGTLTLGLLHSPDQSARQLAIRGLTLSLMLSAAIAACWSQHWRGRRGRRGRRGEAGGVDAGAESDRYDRVET